MGSSWTHVEAVPRYEGCRGSRHRATPRGSARSLLLGSRSSRSSGDADGLTFDFSTVHDAFGQSCRFFSEVVEFCGTQDVVSGAQFYATHTL